MAASVQRRVF